MPARIASVFLLSIGIASANPSPVFHDPPDDAGFLEFESYHGMDRGASQAAVPASGEFRRYAAAMYFPAGKFGVREAFGGLRAEFLERDQGRLGGVQVGAGLVQRYALSGGLEVVKSEGQESYAMAIASWQGDFRRIDWDGVGSEWIYTHLFTGNPGLTWGLGLDLMRFYDEWIPYPLLFLEWRTLERLSLRMNGDVAEARVFPGRNLCATAGFRYNIWYGSLGESATFRLETVGFETGVEWRFRRDFAIRLKGKRHIWGEDALGGLGGRGFADRNARGGSIRLSLGWSP